MKKLTFFTLALIIFLSAHQVEAVNNKANEKANNNSSNENRNEHSNKSEDDNEVEAEDDDAVTTPVVSPSTVQISVSPTLDDDDCDDDVKNHGQFVSCVAKKHEGGKTVSAAARSDIGKKKRNPSITPSVVPSISPSIDPSVTVSPTPTEDPNATPSPTLSFTPTPESGEGLNQQIEGIVNALESLIATLKNLFHL